MNNTLVSIIIPIYKVKKKYIKKCINSIKNQTYKNIEVLCMFDGADTEIIDYCKKLINNDERFKIYSRKNKGVSYTRNEGIKKSSGQWLTFVDADDWLEEDAIEIFINTITKNNFDIDFCLFKTYINKLDKEEISYCKYNDNHIIDKIKKKELFQTTFGTKYGRYNYCESVWKNFYNKKSIIKNNIMFPNDIQVAEDMLFNYQVWQKCGDGYFVNKAIYHYRINEDSVMNSNSEKLLIKYEKLYPIFEYEIAKIDKYYSENYCNFVIKQIKRFFLIYSQKEKNLKQFKILLKKKYYKNIIKQAKLSSMNLKNFIFLFILKFKLYIFLHIISKIYKK